jgi:hypothetical protein
MGKWASQFCGCHQQLWLSLHKLRDDSLAAHIYNTQIAGVTQEQNSKSGLPGERAAMLYFVFNKSVVAVIVAHDLQRGEFVAQVCKCVYARSCTPHAHVS